MKRFLFLFLFLIILFWFPFSGKAQSRKIISQFQEVQGYFNPSMVGYNGSEIKSLVRNQWGSMDRNPKSFYLGADLDFSDLSGNSQNKVEGKNSMGFSLLADGHGAFKENQLLVTYSSRIRVSEKANLRLGAGVIYQGIRLDGNLLTFEQQNDPRLSELVGRVSDQQFLDLNLGIAVTHDNYYFGLSSQRVNSGRISSGDNFIELVPREHIIQAGYRNQLSSDMKLTTDFMFRNWKGGKDMLDMNLRIMFKDAFWVGFGHRFDYASSIQAGVHVNKIRFGFIYEMPSAGSYLLPGNIQEFMLSYSLFN